MRRNGGWNEKELEEVEVVTFAFVSPTIVTHTGKDDVHKGLVRIFRNYKFEEA